jgi:spermidine synthase
MASKKRRSYTEYFSPTSALVHGIEKMIFSEITPFQHVELIITHDFGKCLFLDGKMQSAAVDEFIYHDTLVHPALLLHPNPKNVLIIGGGEGATLREVLKHSSVKRVVMVEIDERVTEISKKYLPEWHAGAFEDKRATVLIMDGRKYIEENDQVFDCILIDLSEPVEDGPAYKLFTRQFYEIVSKRLSPEGTVALQGGSTAVFDCGFLTSVYQTLKTVFPVVRVAEAAIPSFTLPWGFCLASKKFDPVSFSAQEVDKRIASRIGKTLSFYDGETHLSLFNLPRHLRVALEKKAKINEDSNPLVTFTVASPNG